MSRRCGSIVIVLALFWAVGSLRAHHGFGALFDTSRRLTITGTLTKVDWRNPHIELSLEVKNDRGQPESWVIEGGPPNFFARKQIGKTDFESAVGRTVTLEVYRSRDGNLLGYLVKLTLPDGKSLTGDAGG